MGFSYIQITKKQAKKITKQLRKRKDLSSTTLSKSAAECIKISNPNFVQDMQDIFGARIHVKKNLFSRVRGVFIK